MRKSPVKLVLASSLPLALSACGPSEPSYTVTQRVNYDDLAACVADQVPQKDCEHAYQQAYTEHQRSGPIFGALNECEAEFTAGGCETSRGGFYMPLMRGFELETSGEVSESQLAKANNGQGNLSGSMATGVLAGLLLSQVLPSDRHYRSQPLYNYSAGSQGYRRGLLSQRFAIQREPQQEQQGSGSSYSGSGGSGGSSSSYGSSGGSSASSSSYSSSSSNSTSSTSSRTSTSTSGGTRWGSSTRVESRTTVSSSISRGGFGSQATARSGWGGRSSSFFGG